MTRPALFSHRWLAVLGSALALLVVGAVWNQTAPPERADAFANWAAGIEATLGAQPASVATIQPHGAHGWSLAEVQQDQAVNLRARLFGLVCALTLILAAAAFFAPLAWAHWTAHRLSQRALMVEVEQAEQRLEALARTFDEADRRYTNWVATLNRRIRETSGAQKDLAERLDAALRQVEQIEKAVQEKARKPASRKAKRAKPDLPGDRGI